MFYAVPVATIVKNMVYMGLRAILGCSTGSSRLCNSKWNLFMYIDILWHTTQYIQTMFIVASLHYRSGSILAFGWAIMYEWCRSVATLRNDGGNYTSLSLNDIFSANQKLRNAILTGCGSEGIMAAVRAMALVCESSL
eukprot:6194876-Pleurochrysis_carterae.AAC.1